jgi:putative hydrolase of the HAD superfamily
LLLDACGVVLGEPTGPLFRAVALSTGRTPDAVAALFRLRFRDDLWSGSKGEDDFWARFAGACGLSHPPSAWREVIDAAMHPMPALSRLAGWSRHARLVLISNHRHEWLLPRLDACGVTGHFAEVCISSTTGLVKPEPAAYERALGEMDRRSVLYVDDKGANVDAARELGIRSALADRDGLWIGEVDAWLRN